MTHHLSENRPYLERCLRSLLSTAFTRIEIICVSDAEEAPVVPEGVTLYQRPDLDSATKKVHWAIREAISAETTHILLVSDDVMVTRQTIAKMFQTSKRMQAITNPLCNGDNGLRFFTDFVIPAQGDHYLRIPVTLAYQDLQGCENNWIYQDENERSVIIPQNWISFYCTMIPLTVWREVGELDEKLDVRHNDQDYCMRAIRKGHPVVIESSALALHFGSKTLPKVTHQDRYQESTDHFSQKWQVHSP